MKLNGFAKGTITLCALMVISKAIGAFYRLPLTYILGATGMGVYQTIFPVYSLLLAVSSSAAPQALSKLISEKHAKCDYVGERQIMICGTIWLAVFGSICSLLIFILAKNLSCFQGNESIFICYYAISPAIILTALICAYRGYYQGHQNMLPTGISNLVEQVVKLVLGLVFAKLLIARGIIWGVFGALLGVAASEFIALIYLSIKFFFFNHNKQSTICGLNFKHCSASLFRVCLPITIGGIIFPLVQFIDSGLIVNLLVKGGVSVQRATAYFGLSSGAVGSLVNLPVVISLSISSAVLPSISANKAVKNQEKVKEVSTRGLLQVLFLVIPCAIGLFVFSDEFISILYAKALTAEELDVCSRLLQIGAPGVIFLGILQVLSSVLQGQGRYYIPVIAILLGAIVKVVLNISLVQNVNINIFGDQIANVSCYLLASVFCYIFASKQIKASFWREFAKIFVVSAFFGLSLYGISCLAFISNVYLLLVAIAIVAVLYLFVGYKLFVKKWLE
ncbi:MAG: polysaccharide biosynthesis protein [Clostridia bacterium]|nr:polysaccharide biosynthesis protein [Clostridia bacterium]